MGLCPQTPCTSHGLPPAHTGCGGSWPFVINASSSDRSRCCKVLLEVVESPAWPLWGRFRGPRCPGRLVCTAPEAHCASGRSMQVQALPSNDHTHVKGIAPGKSRSASRSGPPGCRHSMPVCQKSGNKRVTHTFGITAASCTLLRGRATQDEHASPVPTKRRCRAAGPQCLSQVAPEASGPVDKHDLPSPVGNRPGLHRGSTTYSVLAGWHIPARCIVTVPIGMCHKLQTHEPRLHCLRMPCRSCSVRSRDTGRHLGGKRTECLSDR